MSTGNNVTYFRCFVSRRTPTNGVIYTTSSNLNSQTVA